MEAEAGRAPLKSASTAESIPGFSYPRQFSGRQLAMIAFPLGGIGRRQHRPWRARSVARLGDLQSPRQGKIPGVRVPCDPRPYRHGRARHACAGVAAHSTIRSLGRPESGPGLRLARLESATFTGEYPLAKIASKIGTCRCWCRSKPSRPSFRLDADASGLPVAILRYVVTNPASQTVEVSIAFSLDNPVGVGVRGEQRAGIAQKRTSEYRESGNLAGLLITNPGAAHDAPLAGSFALCVAGPGDGRVTHLRGWPRAKWWQARCCSGTISPVTVNSARGRRTEQCRIGLPRSLHRARRKSGVHVSSRLALSESHHRFGWEELNGDIVRRGSECHHRQLLLPALPPMPGPRPNTLAKTCPPWSRG